jgi:hypothetical protein
MQRNGVLILMAFWISFCFFIVCMIVYVYAFGILVGILVGYLKINVFCHLRFMR